MSIFSIFIDYIRAPFLILFDLGNGGGSAPPPDPNIAIAAMQNAATAKDALAFSEQAYNNNLPQQQKAADIANQVSTQQLAVSKQNQANAQTQWDNYQTNFAPINAQVAADATGIDSSGNLAVASGNAATQVQAQSDNSNAQLQRQQEAMGVNPNSGRAQALASEGALTTAAAKANAATTTAQNLHAQGISLRAGAANFGAGMPNATANAYGVALNSGNSAVGNAIAPINSANSMASQGLAGYNTAINGTQSSGSMLLGQYNAQLGAYNAQQQADATSSAGIGNMVGTIGAAAVTAF